MAPVNENNDPRYRLYTYFRSSCAARVRIALNLKGVPYTYKLVDFFKNENKSEEYDAINPSHFVPSLRKLTGQHPGSTITQSQAILEFLEEEHPSVAPLLPDRSDPVGRAHVRALVCAIVSDTQPVTNLRILNRVESLGESQRKWAQDFMGDGLAAYERLTEGKAGRFSYGDKITMADVCLVPAMWQAMHYGAEVDKLTTVKRVYEEMMKEEAVAEAYWLNQSDCPPEHRQ